MSPIDGLRVDSMYAYLVVDEEGNEGVPAIPGPNGMTLPMMGADLANMTQFEPYAQAVADQTGREVTLAHFSVRTNGRKFTPRNQGMKAFLRP